MGGTCDADASNSEIAAAVLTIPQTINTNNMTGTIVYEYHYHKGGCLYVCPGTKERKWCVDGVDSGYYSCVCDVCGYHHDGNYGDGDPCGRSWYTCGYSNGQIIGAKITY